MTDIELARRIIPLVQAVAEGKELEVTANTTWFRCELLDAGGHISQGHEVRIKPDPPERKEWWEVRVRQDGACIGEFDTFDEARDYLDKTPQRALFKIVHAEEVW